MADILDPFESCLSSTMDEDHVPQRNSRQTVRLAIVCQYLLDRERICDIQHPGLQTRGQSTATKDKKGATHPEKTVEAHNRLKLVSKPFYEIAPFVPVKQASQIPYKTTVQREACNKGGNVRYRSEETCLADPRYCPDCLIQHMALQPSKRSARTQGYKISVRARTTSSFRGTPTILGGKDASLRVPDRNYIPVRTHTPGENSRDAAHAYRCYEQMFSHVRRNVHAHIHLQDSPSAYHQSDFLRGIQGTPNERPHGRKNGA